MESPLEMDQQPLDQSLTPPSPPIISKEEKETLCKSCLSARSSPTWQARLATAKSTLHCARCKAHHPRCLFSKSQRNSNIPHPIRYCIGHEGLLRLCEHKAVSWRQILALSNSIIRQKVGRKYKVIRCLHSDHLNVDGDGDGDGDGTEEALCSTFKRLGLGVGSMSRRKAGHPTLTVGFKDSNKEFSLILSWEGYISLNVGDPSALKWREAEAEMELREKLEEKLGALRERQGKYICPEPEPGRRIQDVDLEAPSKDGRDFSNDDEAKKRGKVRSMGHKGPSSLSLPLMVCRKGTGISDDIQPLLTRAHSASMIKNGKILGGAKITWGWGIGDQPSDHKTDSTIELDDVEMITNTTAADDKALKRNEKHFRIHSYEYRPEDKHEKSPKKGITDTLKIKPCRLINCIWNHCKSRRLNIVEQLREWRHDHRRERQNSGSHDTGRTVCLRVKYKRRLVVGDDLHGANVRDMIGFQNWMAVLDPDSYKIGQDDEGEGVYWCRGIYEVTKERQGENEGENKDGNGNNNGGGDLDGNTRNVDSSLDTHLNHDLDLAQRKGQCRNYYRHFQSRILGLGLRAEDLTKICTRRGLGNS